MLEKRMYFFKHAGETSRKDMGKIIGSENILKGAYEELDHFSWNEEEVRGYDQMEKYEDAYQSTLTFNYQEGLVTGRMEGLAYRLLKLNIDKNTIVAATNLIEQVYAKMKKE